MSAPGSASRNTVSVMVDVGSATVSYTWSGRITDAPMARESMTAPIVTSTVPTDPATVSVSPTCQPVRHRGGRAVDHRNGERRVEEPDRCTDHGRDLAVHRCAVGDPERVAYSTAVDGEVTPVVGAPVGFFDATLTVPVVDGATAAMADGQAVVQELAAEPKGWQLGDLIADLRDVGAR